MRNIALSVPLLLAFALAAPVASAKDKAPRLRKGVQLQSWGAWPECLALRAGGAQALIAPAAGGRVVSYGLGGENILQETAGASGGVFGAQVDMGPDLRGIADHPALRTAPYAWSTPRDFTVALTSEPEPTLGLRIEKEFVLDPSTGELGVTQTLKSIAKTNLQFCVWDRTACQGGGFVIIPLNKNSRFKAGWSQRKVIDGKALYDGFKPASSQVSVLDGVLVARAQGPATRIGADSAAGWIAYARGRQMLVKHFAYNPRGEYSNGGNSVEAAWDENVVELQPMSPEVRIQPGNKFSFPEKWLLLPLKEEVTTPEQARALAKQIPAFEF